MLYRVLIFCLSLSVTPSLASAQKEQKTKEDRKLEKEAERLDLEAKHIDGDERVMSSLSKRLNVPVEILRTQQENTGFGFGQLFIANALAGATGESFDEIASEFRTGKGWGQIAKDHKANPGEIISGMRKSTAALRNLHQSEIRTRQENKPLEKSREEGRGPTGGRSGRGNEKSRHRGP